MKRIDLRTIPETGQHVHVRFEPGEWQPDEGEDGIVSLAGPLAFEADIQRTGSRFLLNGALQGRVQVRCDRCLETFERDVDARFRTFLALPRGEGREEEVELEEQDLEVDFTTGEEIDLLELVREQVLLELPMKRLCSDDCKGLCPVCGKDLNRGACGCPSETGHPAFQKLKALKPEGEQD